MVQISRNELSLEMKCRMVSGSSVKASGPEELVKLIPIYQKESFPLISVEGANVLLWLHVKSLAPPGSLRSASTFIHSQSVLHPRPSQFPGLPPPDTHLLLL